MGQQEERGPSNLSAQKYLFANDMFVLDQKFIIAVSKDMSWIAHIFWQRWPKFELTGFEG